MKLIHLIILLLLSLTACQEEKGEYVCPPCDLPCDTLFFKHAGICPHCNMELVKASELIDESKLQLNKVELTTGSGIFLVAGTNGTAKRTIKVYYHQPEHFSPDSKILLVIPGAGRNGDSYRDAFIAEAERYNVLVLAPMFAEDDYPFEDYHLCGLIQDANLSTATKFSDTSNIVTLDETVFTYQTTTDSTQWLFNDFDQIFDLVVAATGSFQSKYDLFGHSAGGQILHRLAIFSTSTKINQIVASNSGFYTLPDLATKMPFGIEDMGIHSQHLKEAFARQLTLLIGALDNENETGGTLLRSTTVDKQGTHRLARGQYFYEFSRKKAQELGCVFNWKMEVVSGVGHDHERMGDAATVILYREN